MGSVHRFLVPLVIATATGAGRVDGQTVPADARGPSAPLSAASRPTVRIADSVEAGHELDRIAALESQGRYVQAGRQYDKLLADHGGDIVRSADGSFASVTRVVLGRLESWPADARGLYRDLIEPQAAAKLSSVGQSADPTRWLAAMRRWWLTELAGEAALRCISRLAEDGCVESADWILERLRRAHPELDKRIEECERLLKSRGRAGGSTTQALPTTRGSPSESEAPFWTCDLGAPANRDRENVPATAFARLNRPTVWNDTVVLQDVSRVWCIRLYSGYVEWTFGSDGAAPGSAPDDGSARMRPSTPAVGQDRVFAVLAEGQQERGPGRGTAAAVPVLVSVDLASGGGHWRKPAGEILGRQGGQAVFFCVDPLWYERGLYVVVGERAGAIEDVYLVRVEPVSGKRCGGGT